MEPRNVQMDLASLEKGYDRYFSFYDLMFAAFFSSAHCLLILVRVNVQ